MGGAKSLRMEDPLTNCNWSQGDSLGIDKEGPGTNKYSKIV